uniref:Uncharacterized protein LOC113794359 n=1 Tax=Dermatophagoides pteronyssinus TaxID=6956 RepID=A0A6P6Y6Y1_DERPT|nr:uncharacterized protein LOC113794359 [Dermatophagoides pteronyssinus]
MAISIIPELPKNVRFVTIFQRGFVYLKYFLFRLQFTLEDYQNKNIQWTWKTFRITFMLTSMTLTAIFCLGLLTLFPKDHPFMSFHNIETILETDRMIAYRLYIINGIATIAIAYYWAIIFYKENLITLKESILSMFAFGLIVTDLTYLIGQLFMTILLFIIFVIELFQVKLGELYKFVQKMFDHYSTYNGLKTIFWNQFQNKYVKLYAEIVDFNNSFDVMLFYIETVSKSSIIISCMFYSKQKEISQYCIMVIVSLMSTFICVTILYSRVARLPSYNRRCCKSIMNWLARTQWSSQESKFHSSMIINSMIIKSIFFAQVISENKLGFTCGHLFFITKFKYIQLIILNMLLIILFYQKICINGSF